VFVLHAFEKTTNGVDHKEMATAAKRYKEMRQRVDAEHKRVKTSAAKRGNELCGLGDKYIALDSQGSALGRRYSRGPESDSNLRQESNQLVR
jgi:hypothetical protein